jgi:hypothetical protein
VQIVPAGQTTVGCCASEGLAVAGAVDLAGMRAFCTEDCPLAWRGANASTKAHDSGDMHMFRERSATHAGAEEETGVELFRLGQSVCLKNRQAPFC